MEHADAERRLQVRTNADTAEDAGPGPAVRRAGHRAVPHRAHVPRRAPRARREPDRGRRRGRSRRRRSPSCCRCSARTSPEIFEAMDGLPVTIRLIDPPLHEFLPDLTELSVAGGARGRARHRKTAGTHKLLAAVQPAARAEPDARPARRPPRHRDPGPVHDAGPGDPRGGRRPDRGRRRPAAGDHDPAGRHASASSTLVQGRDRAGRAGRPGGARASRCRSRSAP